MTNPADPIQALLDDQDRAWRILKSLDGRPARGHEELLDGPIELGADTLALATELGLRLERPDRVARLAAAMLSGSLRLFAHPACPIPDCDVCHDVLHLTPRKIRAADKRAGRQWIEDTVMRWAEKQGRVLDPMTLGELAETSEAALVAWFDRLKERSRSGVGEVMDSWIRRRFAWRDGRPIPEFRLDAERVRRARDGLVESIASPAGS